MPLQTRTECDSVGSMELPADAYYGVQALRGKENFPITGTLVNWGFVKNIVKIKKAAARVNGRNGQITKEIENAIVTACDEILRDCYKEEFITDAIQGGAGTSVNMNVNEVIANRASELMGEAKGTYLCHPNDHVNRAQSTNDIIPSAGKMTVIEMSRGLLAALKGLIVALEAKAEEFDCVLKMGRTQLQDAVPIRLGQEFSAYAAVLKRDCRRIETALGEMRVLNLGGTAIGTSINVDKAYLREIVSEVSLVFGEEFVRAENLVDATQNADSFCTVSGTLKTLAVDLSKICNDLRLMSSGPQTGIGEIRLPAKQNGSSIMPGKVNPVIPEVVSQVAFAVVGNDVTISMATESGQLELNAFEPIILYKLFESLTCLTGAMNTLTKNCIVGIVANGERCAELVNSSVGIVTALCPYLGYKKCAEIAKEALLKKARIKDLVLQYGLLDEETLDKVLDPYKMT